MIYLDNNATTPLLPEVLEEMLPFLREEFGNPSSVHCAGSRVLRKIDQARERVAQFLQASDPSEIVFTSGGTESNHLAIFGILPLLQKKRHVLTTQVEHPSVIGPFEELERSGYEVMRIGVDEEGRMNWEEFESALRPETAFCSVMAANNETGVLFPVDRIAEILKGRGIFFHVDAIQAAGKIPLGVRDLGVDLLSISAHKIHGPKGVGALYIRKGLKLAPWLVGGHQERGRRGGTENVAGIMGLGKAAELASRGIVEDGMRVTRMRDVLENALLKQFPIAVRNGDSSQRLPNTSNLSFVGLESEAVVYALSDAGVCVSSGSACSAGSLDPSHVLEAMRISRERLKSAIRFSVSRLNQESEIEEAVLVIKEVIARLYRMNSLEYQREEERISS